MGFTVAAGLPAPPEPGCLSGLFGFFVVARLEVGTLCPAAGSYGHFSTKPRRVLKSCLRKNVFSRHGVSSFVNAARSGPQNGGTQMFKYPAEGKEKQKIERISRRDFLNTAGAAAAGGLVVVAGSGLLGGNQAKAAVPEAPPPVPWKYSKLDPMEAGKRGYQNYLAKGG
jgi:hypothetical protein